MTDRGSTITSSATPDAAPARDHPEPGTVIANRYEVVRFIDHGGMGAVYEVLDRSLHEHVALKTIRSERAFEPRAVERFKREALLARRVTHRNVCRVFDVGHHAGEMFLTMELLAGETLSARLARDGKLAEAAALPIVEQIVAALAAAHAAGVIHRDLKCSNAMLVEDRVVVTDFGLAHDVMASGHEASTDGFIGSPAYVAPEQVGGRHVSPASDIYSLGVVMFEMVTGTLPWIGATPMATAVMRLHEPAPSPRERVPELSVAWERTILRCLEREPAARFAHVEDVLAELTAPDGARPPRRPRRRSRALPLVAAGIVAIAGGGTAWYALRGQPEASVETAGASISMTPRAALHYTQGVLALEHFQFPAAQHELEAALVTDPDQPLVYAALATVFKALEASQREREAARKAFELGKDLDQEHRLAIEAAYRESLRDWPAAAKLRSALATFYPDNLEYGLALIDAQRRARQNDDGLATIARLRHLRSPEGDDPRIDVQEAGIRSTSDPNAARALLARAISISTVRGAIGVEAAAQASSCTLEASGLHLDLAVSACNAARSLYESERNLLGQARAAYTLASAYLTARQPQEVEKHASRALELCHQAGSRTCELRVDMLLGLAAKRAGELAKATAIWRETITGFEQAGEPYLQIQAMDDLASVLTDQNRQDEAIPLYRRVIEVAHANGFTSIEANSMSNFSITLTQRGELDEARTFAEGAVEKWKQLGQANDAVFGMDSMGQIAIRQGRLAEARAIEEEALATREKLGWIGGPSRQNLSGIELVERNYDRAATLARKAADEFRASNEPTSEMYAHDVLVRALVEAGRLDEAAKAGARMTELATNSGANRFTTVSALSLLGAARGDATGAAVALRAAIAEDRRIGDVDNELDQLEVLAEILVKHGPPGEARKVLADLRVQAKAHGYTQTLRDADAFELTRHGR